MMAKKMLIMLSAAVLALGFANVCTAQDKVVAVVNDEIITQKDLDGFISFMRVQLAREYSAIKLEQKIDSMKLDLLERLIEDRLILQEARKANINIDKSRIKGKVLDLKRAHDTEVEFQSFLSQQGVTEADLEKKLKDQMMTYEIIESKIKNKIVIKPSDITDYYNNNLDQFIVAEEREFISIVVESKDLADKVSQSLKSGKAIDAAAAELAVKLNTFTAKKDGELKKEIEDVVFAMNVDDVSESVKIDNAYYVFKLTKIIPGYKQQLIDAQTSINRMLFDKKLQENMVDWLNELKKKSYIKIM